MKFDSNQAWQGTTAAITANREVVYALAGVFFLLPGLVMALLFPVPEPGEGLDQAEVVALMSEYYVSIMPITIPMVLFQAAGTLALLNMLTDNTSPTVGEAISMGLKGIIPYFLAQILLGLGVGLVGGVLLAIGTVFGVPAIGIAIMAALAVYALIKTSLVAPVIAVEGERNPIAALKRSWALTRGNSVRIALFYALVFVVFFVAVMAITALVGLAVAMIADAHTVRMAGAVISSALNAVMALYFVAIIAATHRQLAGRSPQAESAPFE